jgi:DNA-binding response OmpR family regulator
MREGSNVLVVEDERLVAETIAGALDDGYTVSVGANVAEAVRSLRETEFAAVLLDYLLPDGDTAEIFGAAEARDMPVVLMSGDPGHIEVFCAESRPFLSKPFSIEELLKTLRSVIT